MQTVAKLIALLVQLAILGVIVWTVVMFYRALARIGEELSEIKTVLRLRLPPPAGPGDQ